MTWAFFFTRLQSCRLLSCSALFLLFKKNLKSLVNFFFNAEKNMSVVKPHVPFCRTEETLPTLEIPCWRRGVDGAEIDGTTGVGECKCWSVNKYGDRSIAFRPAMKTRLEIGGTKVQKSDSVCSQVHLHNCLLLEIALPEQVPLLEMWKSL